MSGNLIDNNWLNNDVKSNFFYLKNILVNIFEKFNISHEEEINENGINFNVKNKKIGSVINLNDNLLKKYSIPHNVFCATINMSILFEFVNNSFFNVTKISKYPNVKRDFSFVLNKEVSYKDIKASINSLNNDLIKEIKLFDIFKDDKIEKSKKSISISVILNSDKKTLNEKTIEIVSDKIIGVLKKKFEATLRD